MSEEAGGLIRSLNGRVSDLERENAELRAEAKKHRLGKRDLATELEQVKAATADLTRDRDGWKAKAEAAPDDKDREIGDLKNQVRTRDHRDAFRDAVGGELVDKATVEHLWAELKYEPGEAVPDRAQIAELTGKVRESAPWLFRQQEAQTGQQPRDGAKGGALTVPARGAPNGSGRTASGTTARGYEYKRSDVAVPGWQQNRPELAAALIKGEAVCVGD